MPSANTENLYKYYAFISYSHRGNTPLAEKIRKTFPQSTLFAKDDMKWAIWLQHKLEAYHLPASICEKFEIDPQQRIRPVFRDEEELGCGLLHKELYRNLDASRYLIVLCSPNSARANKDGFHYIDNEINHFISINGTDRVIPVIIDGIPNDPEQECFPPEIKKHNFIGIDAVKLGRERAFSNIVAKLLELSPDELWERERRRIRRRKAVNCFLGILLLCTLSAAAYKAYKYYVPFVKYYESIVWRNMEPAGVNQIGPETVRRRPFSWKLTYHKGHLHKVQYINSRGFVRNHTESLAEFEIVSRFSEGKTAETIYLKDFYGTLRYVQKVSKLKDNVFRVKFESTLGLPQKAPYVFDYIPKRVVPTELTAPAIMPGMKSPDSNDLSYSQTVGYDITLDDSGNIKRLVPINHFNVVPLFTEWNEITVNYDGNMLKEYMQMGTKLAQGKKYNTSTILEAGRIIQRNLPAFAIAAPEKKNNNAISENFSALINNNTFIKNIKYDKNDGNMLSIIVDYSGKEVIYLFDYIWDEESNLKAVRIKESGKKDTVDISFNSYGDVCKVEYPDHPAKSFIYEYYPNNTVHRLKIDNRFRNTETAIGLMKDIQLEMDTRGNVIKGYYNDGTKDNYLRLEYNSENLPHKISFFADGDLTRKTSITTSSIDENLFSAHSEETLYYKTGRKSKEIYRNEAGNVVKEIGYSYRMTNDILDTKILHIKSPAQEYYLHQVFDRYGRQIGESYSKDASGRERFVNPARGYAEARTQYYENTVKISRVTFYGVDPAEKYNNPLKGGAEMIIEYDRYGNKALDYFLDKDGKILKDRESQVYGVRYIYEQKYAGKLLSVTGLDSDLKTPLKDARGIYEERYTYKNTGQKESTYYFGTQEQLKNNTFAYCDTILYNQYEKSYGYIRYCTDPFFISRVKNYVRITSVTPGSPAAVNGVLAGDFIIKAPGFDEREDCTLSFQEKSALLKSAVSRKNKMYITARPGADGKIYTIEHPNIQYEFGVAYKEWMLTDHLLYDHIKK